MRVIVKYSKNDEAIYVSHLDVQRSMQRALRRSGLPIKYTLGFHPHVALTFALPLSVAVESRGEYMEFSLMEYVPPETIKAKLNQVIAPGFYAESCGYISKEYKSLMSMVAMCEWIVLVSNTSQRELDEKIRKIYESTEISVEKHTKKGYRSVEIREGIFDIKPILEIPNAVQMQLASGGKSNISPKLVLSAMNIEPKYAKIIRKDIYFEKAGKHYPLLSMCNKPNF
ncbi:MAG: TIGR03936 family radical SAM-associated protein [Eubacteriales bacterium]